MKKISTIVLVLALVLILPIIAACNGDAADPEIGQDSNVEEAANDAVNGFRDPTGEINLSNVAIVMPTLVHEFFIDVEHEIRSILEAEGISVQTETWDNDAALRSSILENFRLMDIDGIVLFAGADGGPGQDAILNDLVDDGVRVVTFITRVEANVHAQVLVNNSDVGTINARMAAEWVEETFPDAEPGSIEVGVLSIRVGQDAIDLVEGMYRITEFTDKVTIVGEIEGTFACQEVDIMANTETLLSRHPNIQLILAHNHSNAVNEVVMRTPDIDFERFAIFSNTIERVAAENLILSRDNSSVVRGIATAGSFGRYYHVGEAMLGRLTVDENGIYWDQAMAVTPDNVEEVIALAGW